MLKKLIYLSPFGLMISLIQNIAKKLTTPFMVYGYWNTPTNSFKRLTRVSSSAVISDKKNINIGDNCWIWHHSILDGSNGIEIEEGVQIGAWVGIFTHSSHVAVRLHGKNYINIDRDERIGYLRAPVKIGSYTFIGAGACILPGVEIGKGSLIGAGSVVNKSIPEFSIVQGNPAKVIGSTLDIDSKFFGIPEVQNNYFDAEKIKEHLKKSNLTTN
jgi:acetyltransferase-like isoleucine patch superfamily enzyme